MRGFLIALTLVALAGCSSPSSTSNDHATTATTEAPPALAPLNASFSGRIEFAVSAENPVLDGCGVESVTAALLSGNRLTLDVPNGYKHGNATATVSTPSPVGSYRICVNLEDGTNLATATGAAPLTVPFDAQAATIYMFLYADNTAPTSPVIAADFTLTMSVTA